MAVRCIQNAQNREGGWRYLPGAEDADMSVTVCQVMALRAAAAGLAIALGVGGWARWQAVQSAQRAEIYAAAVMQDQLEDFDVIASLDFLNGGSQL